MTEKSKVFGTKEWAKYNFNIVKGCEHGCLYCYAHYNDVKRFKTVTEENWKKLTLIPKNVNKKWKKMSGTIMFPTQHDIFPEIMPETITVLKSMLSAGNNVLIVSKPHLECIKAICDELAQYKEQILFRFTIGALNDYILSYWEPNAPDSNERIESLEYAYNHGFRTSISMEPVLDWENLIFNFKSMATFVTDSIWVGIMNDINKRVEIKTDEDRKRVNDLVKWHNMENYQKVYNQLKDHPLIKWKESMKSALGLEIPDEIGLDV